MQTQAIVFPNVNQVALETIELPEPLPGDAVIDVEMSGVSVGTEVWALTGQRPPGDTRFPCVPGYQAVGIVRQAGRESALKPGERVFFTKSRLTGARGQNWMGSHLATAIIDASEMPTYGYWVKIPENVGPEDVVLSALAAVTARGLDHVNVYRGDFCVVIGQGVIGQTSAQIARILGAEVLAADVVPERLELAAKYSANWVCNPQKKDLEGEVRQHCTDGAELVVEASGNKNLIPTAISLVRPLGRVLLQGWYPGEVAFDFHQAHLRRPTIAVTCGMDQDSNRRAVQWVAEGKLRLAPLLTRTFKPEQAIEAYEMMRTRPGDFLGVAFDWR